MWRLVPLAAVVATSGCFATRGDVRIVQSDIATLRAEILKHQLEQREALGQTMRTLQVASDSLSKVSVRTVSIQGDVRGEIGAVLLGQVPGRKNAADITVYKSLGHIARGRTGSGSAGRRRSAAGDSGRRTYHGAHPD